MFRLMTIDRYGRELEFGTFDISMRDAVDMLGWAKEKAENQLCWIMKGDVIVPVTEVNDEDYPPVQS